MLLLQMGFGHARVVCSMRAKRILRNFCNLSLGKVLGDLATLALFVILSRTFGDVGLGKYSFAMALGGFCLIATDFGLFPYTVREISRVAEPPGEVFARILSLRASLALVVSSLLILGCLVAPLEAETRVILILIGLSQVCYALADGFLAFFIAKERMEVAAFCEFLLRTAAALAAILAIWFGGSLLVVATVLAASYFGGLIAIFLFSQRSLGLKFGGVSLQSLRRLFVAAIPFATVPMVRQLATRMDIFFIAMFLGAGTVGIYNAAFRVVFLLFPLFHLASMSILPSASALHGDSDAAYRTLIHRALGSVSLLSLPAAVGLWFVAPDIIDLMYGDQFQPSGAVLQMLAVLVFTFPTVSILNMALIAGHRERRMAVAEGVGLVVGAAMFALLVPLAGLTGAVWAAIATQAVVLFQMIWALRDVLDWPALRQRLLIAAVGSAAFGVPLALLPPLPLFLTIPLAILLYGAAISCFRDVRSKELALLMQFAMGKDRLRRSESES